MSNYCLSKSSEGKNVQKISVDEESFLSTLCGNKNNNNNNNNEICVLLKDSLEIHILYVA